VRYTHRNRIAEMPLRVTAGFSYEQALDDRSSLATDANRNLAGGLANLTGSPTQRARARNEENNSRSSDFYAQGELDVSDRLGLHLGARYSQVRIQFVDKIPASINPVGSGTNAYHARQPGGRHRVQDHPALNWYANAGGGFDANQHRAGLQGAERHHRRWQRSEPGPQAGHQQELRDRSESLSR
jgi:iron complex outermembrane receptor protein